jgi:hypothetical protein
MIKTIILVSIGVFQSYILDNIEQLVLLRFTNIHIITEKTNFIKFQNIKNIYLVDSDQINVDYYNQNTKLDNYYRDGFINNTSKRFFLIYEYMKINNIKSVIHLENDVLLYSNLNFSFEEKIYITMDSKERCIPGIIYIYKHDLLQNLINNYIFTKNDMINWCNFYNNNRNIIKTFPIINNTTEKSIYNINYQQFKSIFDAAAIGQYLGGVDERNISGNTTGFINETCEITYNKYKFKWIKKDKYYFPYILINNELISINNLHIHSKKLNFFKINNPCENKYIEIIK